ncbi:hypothetical protein [Bdellovibrio sp. HCB2-146]|uniref:hypothetical protein n=1 Tax=Bdellovibrio sp. HCB2-146 TaxID=3394362 RepID=UPI0039BCB0EA
MKSVKIALALTLATFTLSSALAEVQVIKTGPGSRHDRRDDDRWGRGGDRRDDRRDERWGRDDRRGDWRDDRRDDRRPGPGYEDRGRGPGHWDRDGRRREREAWNNRFRIERPSRHSGYRDMNNWRPRYDRWYRDSRRPSYFSPSARIRWNRPMPAPGAWRYNQLENIADNLEYISRDVYETMDRVALYNEYGMRLRRVLVGLIDAADNFNDSVNSRYDWNDSLSDLFYLESQLDLAEQTLSGYSQAYRVQDEMGSIRYYVNELLWTYRQNCR